jgi:HK97 family phage portal protein
MQFLRRRTSEERSLPALPGSSDQYWNWHPDESGAPTPSSSLAIADVLACVRVLADSAASVPLIPYRAADAGRTRLTGGRLSSLLDQPAPATTQASLVGTLMSHLALWGNGFVGKFRGETGVIEQLGMLHPDYVQVEIRAGTPDYTVTDPKTGRESHHGPEDIVHVKGVSTDGLVGLSPIKQARMAVSLSKGLGEFSEAFVRNGARPSGILKIGSGSTSQQMEWTSEVVDERHGGARNAHRIAVLRGDVDWIPMTGPLDDLQFCEQRKLSTAEVARIFRVPVWMIGGTTGDSQTYANAEQWALQFVTYSLRPWCVVIEQAISTDPDLCPGNVYVEFLLDALLRADSATRSDVYTKALSPETGWMTRAEVRRLENLDPEEGAPA